MEALFWQDLADNYLELAKFRLYGDSGPGRESTLHALYHTQLSILKLLAPILPHITDVIYREIYKKHEAQPSIHAGGWPL